MIECIFCKIIKRELPADIVYENERVIVFKDIKPAAPIHLLIIPKKHIISMNNIEEDDQRLIGELFIVAKKVAEERGVLGSGYRLIINVGKDAGQRVDHLHLHLLGGGKLPEKLTKNNI